MMFNNWFKLIFKEANNMRLFHRIIIGGLALFLLVGGFASSVCSAPVYFAYHKVPYEVRSGKLVSVEEEYVSAFREVVKISGVPWLRLVIGDYNLGEGSYIKITSLADGGSQILKTESIQHWRNRTAFFNGDAVEVRVYVAPGDTGVFVNIDEAIFGEPGEQEFEVEAFCGDDDRVPSSDPAIGRFVFDTGTDQYAKCTAWITSSGANLTAGHCAPLDSLGLPDMFEFNIPASLADGTPVFADPNDQYPVDQGSIVARANGVGDDWTVFGCFANSNTDLLPVQAQNAFYRMSRDTVPANIRITGFGVDDTPQTRNRTQQTDWGPYLGENVRAGVAVDHEYIVDTQSGNSGGPVIVYGTTVALGIHAHGGCNPPDAGNHGTSFENDDLENAIQIFPGANVMYADAGHPVATEDGTVFRPYNTVTEAVSAVTSGGLVSIVTGSYTAAAGNTFTVGADGKSMTFAVPVGTVYIGN